MHAKGISQERAEEAERRSAEEERIAVLYFTHSAVR
jgi:hypothetical protein